MPWVSISLDVEPEAADKWGDALLEAGAQSVWTQGARLSALFIPEDDIDARLAAAGMAGHRYASEIVQDADWVRLTQAQFPPLAVGDRLWVGASWHTPPGNRAVVRLDPGLAFGTGSHPSTRLVLRYLETSIRGGERVLDYGCGSGILAIAAARLGASHVDAVDLDPQAVDTTLANAQANQVAVKAGMPEMLTAQYDIVVSNILSQTLIVLAPVLAARTGRGGRLALSGILESQAQDVAAAYEPDFHLGVAGTEEGWALLAGERR